MLSRILAQIAQGALCKSKSLCGWWLYGGAVDGGQMLLTAMVGYQVSVECRMQFTLSKKNKKCSL